MGTQCGKHCLKLISFVFLSLLLCLLLGLWFPLICTPLGKLRLFRGEGALRIFILSYRTEGRRAGGDGAGGVIAWSTFSSHGDRVTEHKVDGVMMRCGSGHKVSVIRSEHLEGSFGRIVHARNYFTDMEEFGISV